MVNDESLDELTEKPYNFERVVQNFRKDAHEDLEDSFEDFQRHSKIVQI